MESLANAHLSYSLNEPEAQVAPEIFRETEWYQNRVRLAEADLKATMAEKHPDVPYCIAWEPTCRHSQRPDVRNHFCDAFSVVRGTAADADVKMYVLPLDEYPSFPVDPAKYVELARTIAPLLPMEEFHVG